MTTQPGSIPSKNSAAASRAPAERVVFVDKMLYCKDCRDPFVFTVGEQRFFQEKGFQNEPARCPDCRRKRRRWRGDRG